MINCRRPYCAWEFATEAARDKHEADAAKHSPEAMTYICTSISHADAIEEFGYCPECQ